MFWCRLLLWRVDREGGIFSQGQDDRGWVSRVLKRVFTLSLRLSLRLRDAKALFGENPSSWMWMRGLEGEYLSSGWGRRGLEGE